MKTKDGPRKQKLLGHGIRSAEGHEKKGRCEKHWYQPLLPLRGDFSHMTVSFPSEHSWHFPSSLFPPYLGVYFLLQGKCGMQISGPSPESRRSLAAAFCLQPKISPRLEGLENQQAGLLQNLIWLLDAK